VATASIPDSVRQNGRPFDNAPWKESSDIFRGYTLE
jgi:hypothetical protein